MENQTLALIASFIAMAFVIMAYFVKKKAYYLLCELLCIVFLVISYFFTVQFNGASLDSQLAVADI